MNMQIRTQNLASALPVHKIRGRTAADPSFAAIERDRKVHRAFEDFLAEKSRFDEGRRDENGKFKDVPECADFDARERATSGAEREAATELAETLPSTNAGALAKLDYVVSEEERGNDLYTEGELTSFIRDMLDSGVLSEGFSNRHKARPDAREAKGLGKMPGVSAGSRTESAK